MSRRGSQWRRGGAILVQKAAENAAESGEETMDKNQILWEKCAEFHGHECGGLTIGYKAALYAAELLCLRRGEDGCVMPTEDLLCVAENKTCSVDAIRVALGCREERGNLVFHMTDTQAFTVFDRARRQAVRLVLLPPPEGLTRETSFAYYQSREPRELFRQQPVRYDLPESAREQRTCVCEVCGESGSADWFRFVDGKALCLDCFAEREEA